MPSELFLIWAIRIAQSVVDKILDRNKMTLVEQHIAKDQILEIKRMESER